MGNTFGKIFKVTTFGESHGRAIGGIIDGCPPGIEVDFDYIQSELNRRKPGQSIITTSRNEPDSVEFLSGLFEGKTTGTPIAFCVWNAQQRSQDYDSMKELFRPSHADYTYFKKYGIRDNRGGGRSSARETISRVVAGALARQILKQKNITITAYTSAVGHIKADKPYGEYDFNNIEKNIVRCPDPEKAEEMISYIKELKSQGDSIGGTITCIIKGVSPGLGEPVFDKLNVALGAAVLSINAVKGFEFGSGFDISKKGSELNDSFVCENGKIKTKTNNSGGIQGGISNGEDIYFKVAFKPIATILQEQKTVDKLGEAVSFTAHGRHDPCVLPRAVPIVEAMAALTILDYYMIGDCKRI